MTEHQKDRVVDLEGNDVTGCEWCEALQARDWQTAERLSDEGVTCTCATPQDPDPHFGKPTGVRCEGCDRMQKVGDEGWESNEDLTWCPDCWVEDEDPDEEPEWPVLKLVRPPAWTGDGVWVIAGDGEEPHCPTETYYPAGAPNVLSPEEAPIIANFLHMPPEMDDEAVEIVTRVYRRLADYGKGTQP